MIKEIDNLEIEELNIFSLSETQLLRYYEPQPGIFIAESPKVIERALDNGYEPLSMLVQKKQAETEAKNVVERLFNVPVYLAEEGVMKRITGYELTRGALCAMRRRELPDIQSIGRGAGRIVVLENVVNPTNVGAIIRNAAALGFDGVVLTKGCSDPFYRRALRVSMGTALQIPWTYMAEHENGKSYIEILKEQGFKTVAMALKEDTRNIDDPDLKSEPKMAVIMGTEGEGLSDETIEKSDYTVCIPMYHGVDSLNVASASAIALWELGQLPS